MILNREEIIETSKEHLEAFIDYWYSTYGTANGLLEYITDQLPILIDDNEEEVTG